MPLLTVHFPKYEPKVKLIQIGPAKKDFQG